jgi:hypothetical protein
MAKVSNQFRVDPHSDSSEWQELLVLKIAMASFLLILGVGLLSWLALLLS